MRRDDRALGQRGGDPIRLGDVLPAGLARLGPAGVWSEVRLRKVWLQAVGPTVGAHSTVKRLRGRVLEVAVEEDTWATELRYLSTVIVGRLNELLGEKVVDELVVRRGRKPPK